MGADGGSIPDRSDLVKTKAAPRVADKALLRELYLLCALSKKPLNRPVVADPLGKLYNKDAIIEYFLDKSKYGDGDQICGYLKGVKDLLTLNLTLNPTLSPPSSSTTNAVPLRAPFVCPLTFREMSGTVPFIALRPCGCVFSDAAIRAVIPSLSKGVAAAVTEEAPVETEKEREATEKESLVACPNCTKAFDPTLPTSVLAINPSRLIQESLLENLLITRASVKSKKRKADSAVSGEVDTKAAKTKVKKEKEKEKVVLVPTIKAASSVAQKLAEQEQKRLVAQEGMSDAVKAMFKPKDKDKDYHKGNADFFGRTFTRRASSALASTSNLVIAGLRKWRRGPNAKSGSGSGSDGVFGSAGMTKRGLGMGMQGTPGQPKKLRKTSQSIGTESTPRGQRLPLDDTATFADSVMLDSESSSIPEPSVSFDNVEPIPVPAPDRSLPEAMSGIFSEITEEVVRDLEVPLNDLSLQLSRDATPGFDTGGYGGVEEYLVPLNDVSSFSALGLTTTRSMGDEVDVSVPLNDLEGRAPSSQATSKIATRRSTPYKVPGAKVPSCSEEEDETTIISEQREKEFRERRSQKRNRSRGSGEGRGGPTPVSKRTRLSLPLVLGTSQSKERDSTLMIGSTVERSGEGKAELPVASTKREEIQRDRELEHGSAAASEGTSRRGPAIVGEEIISETKSSKKEGLVAGVDYEDDGVREVESDFIAEDELEVGRHGQDGGEDVLPRESGDAIVGLHSTHSEGGSHQQSSLRNKDAPFPNTTLNEQSDVTLGFDWLFNRLRGAVPSFPFPWFSIDRSRHRPD
ncbi:replication termination factor 2, partial [Tremellales sp. Uapishka_1]